MEAESIPITRTSCTLILPVRNEALSLGKLLNECQEVLKDDPDYEWSVVVADNGSTDGSRVIAEGHSFVRHILRACVLPGYGRTLRWGLDLCATDLCVFFDGDGSYDPRDAMRAVRRLTQGVYYNKKTAIAQIGCDLVVGQRVGLPPIMNGIHRGAMPWLHRYIGTPFLTWLMNWKHGTDIGDVNGGLRAVRMSAYRTWGCKAPGFEFASEMIIKAHQASAEIDEIAISYRKTPKGRRSHIRTFRDGFRHVRQILWG